ncbi:MAG: DUF4956 domain-containing protein [Gemmatimonadaceae bacterium]
MGTSTNGSSATSATKVLFRVGLYYIVITALGFAAWRYWPQTRFVSVESLDSLFGSMPILGKVSKNAPLLPAPDQGSFAMTVGLAMIAALMCALPVAWIYALTRSRRGYSQSVVQMLVIMPVAVSGIFVLVKYSTALAFGLGGIAAAVRFRNTLDDSKDAVFVILVIGLGIAAGVDIPVALVISFLFNLVIATLWLSDFGRTPVALDGRLAERRLARARQLARTGTFVARIDDEVLKNMTSEQLEGVAMRAWSRAREHDPEGGAAGKKKKENRVVVRLRDVDRIRPIVESQLTESTKKWNVDNVVKREDGVTVVEYVVTPKKSKGPDELLSLLRAAGGVEPVDAEIQ